MPVSQMDMKPKIIHRAVLSLTTVLAFLPSLGAEEPPKPFKVAAFYTGKEDQAHISFVKEANEWFPAMAKENGFTYETTNDWKKLNAGYLADCKVVVFLDTRPESPEQRQAFQDYMEKGGAWVGFHFAAFALKDSAVKPDWSWYHDTFLGSGEYGSNTWRPTSAVLKVESPDHPVLNDIPATFQSAPNEWYRWSKKLRENPDITVLLSIDTSSFPVGTGPKPHEIWHSGDYPVAWSNKNYRMVYFNMGHNDIDYGKTNKELSFTFKNETQNKLVLNSLLWLGGRNSK